MDLKKLFPTYFNPSFPEFYRTNENFAVKAARLGRIEDLKYFLERGVTNVKCTLSPSITKEDRLNVFTFLLKQVEEHGETLNNYFLFLLLKRSIEEKAPKIRKKILELESFQSETVEFLFRISTLSSEYQKVLQDQIE